MNKSRLGLLALALTAYYFLAIYLAGGFSVPISQTIRSIPDALDYLGLADFLGGHGSGAMLQRRTFVYPLYILIVRTLGGDQLLWLSHAALWVISGLLMWANLTVLVDSKALRVLVYSFFVLCWTPILLTMFAATENLALFTFSLLVYLLLRSRFIAYIVSLGVLAMIKPNFLPLHLASIAFFTFIYLRGYRVGPTKAFFRSVAISFIPILFQMTLHHHVTGKFAISNIGNEVMRTSIYAEIRAEQQGRKYDDEFFAESLKANVTTPEILRFLAQHPGRTAHFYFKNLAENIRLVFHPFHDYSQTEHWFRRRLNDFFYWLHMLMVIPILLALGLSCRMKGQDDLTIVGLAILFLGAFLPTGITLWAADRWMAPLMVVWPVFYVAVVLKISELRNWNSKRAHPLTQ